MFSAPDHPLLVPFNGNFRLEDYPTAPAHDSPGKSELKDRLERENRWLARWQRKLYAHDRYALLLIFQAMDAAGKDSTIRAVFTGEESLVTPGVFQGRDRQYHGTVGLGLVYERFKLDFAVDVTETRNQWLLSLILRGKQGK